MKQRNKDFIVWVSTKRKAEELLASLFIANRIFHLKSNCELVELDISSLRYGVSGTTLPITLQLIEHLLNSEHEDYIIDTMDA